MDSIPTKISWKKHVLFYIVFQVLKVLIINICKIQLPDLLFPVVFINFYISRDDFSQIFRTPFSIIWKKDFRHQFFFFNGFPQPSPPHPCLLNGQNPLSVAEVFCRCSLTQYVLAENKSPCFIVELSKQNLL